MIEFKFNDLKFILTEDRLRAVYLDNYYFDIKAEDMQRLGRWRLTEQSGLEIEKSSQRRFEAVINSGFLNLRNRINNRKTVYVHKNSGIPLLGSNYFGLIDRNTNLIEVRPNTGCNLNCIYCSVNEGISSRAGRAGRANRANNAAEQGTSGRVDYLVEKDYLVSELKKLVLSKRCDDVEVHIGPQGEPLLYKPLPELVRDIDAIPEVNRISIDTNAVLLNKSLADALISAGMTQFNISVNAVDPVIARKMAGCGYSPQNALEISRYIAEKGARKGVKVLVAPLWLPGINDNEIEKLIVFAKDYGLLIGIQNYLEYKRGKRPAKAMPMETFYSRLNALEKRYSVKLILTSEDFNIHKTEKQKKLFCKGELVDAVAVCPGILKGEILARAKGSLLHVRNCPDSFFLSKDPFQSEKQVKARVTRVKHNIFYSVYS
ncbi:radical SAM protein [Candidatus Woesearchaeota archaeon]|nr:radical SAM protein [Candidatus Woesearchaeota archaeon]